MAKSAEQHRGEVMALVHQGRTQRANGRDTTQNSADFANKLRELGPNGVALAAVITPPDDQPNS